MKSDNFSEIIRLASNLSVGLPLILYITKIKNASRSIHKVGALVLLSGIADGVSFWLYGQGRSTQLVFNMYYVSSFIVLSWFYYGLFVQRFSRNLVVAGGLIFAISFVLVTAFVQPFTEFQTIMWTINGILALLFSISYFLSVFSAQQPLENYGLLWINSGILFYFSFNLFLFVMSSYVLTQLAPELSRLIWSFHNVNNIVKNILLALGISFYQKDSPAVRQPSVIR